MAESIVVMMEDLLFLSKIMETAKAIDVKVVRGDAQGGKAALRDAQPQAIILDLNSRTLPAVELIQSLKADPATRPIRIVGFVSHVQEELISAARAAGCDSILTRSAFTKRLPELLRTLATGSDEFT